MTPEQEKIVEEVLIKYALDEEGLTLAVAKQRIASAFGADTEKDEADIAKIAALIGR